MNLKERINETLQSLTEAEIQPSTLKGPGWNNAYWEIRKDINPEGKNLYVIKLYNEGPEMSAKDIAAGKVRDSQTRYLKINMGMTPVSAPVGKQWMKKNIGTANFSFSYTPAEATKFAVNNVSELDDLTNQLQKRKARKELTYTKVAAELFEKGNKKSDKDILSRGENFSLEDIVKGYIGVLFAAIEGTKIGNKVPVDGDLAFSGTPGKITLSGNANNFYNNVFTSGGNLDTKKCAAILEDGTNSPLWGNVALSVGAFLYAHGQTGDVISRARRLLRSLKDSSRVKTCSGISMALAVNPDMLNFTNDDFAKTIQLIDNMLYSSSYSGIKNSRYTNASGDLKRTVAYYIVANESVYKAAEEEAQFLRNYLLGVESHLKFDNVKEILPAGSEEEISNKFSTIELKEYKEIESDARTLLLKENEGSTALFIKYRVNDKDWSDAAALAWDGDSSIDIYRDIDGTVKRDVLNSIFGPKAKEGQKLPEKSRLYFCITLDKKSKEYLKINSIDSDLKDKSKIISDNMVAEIDISGLSRDDFKNIDIAFERREDGNILYLNGMDISSGPAVDGESGATEESDSETSDKSKPISSDESVDAKAAEEVGAAEEVSEEGAKEAKDLVSLGLLDEIEPDGTEKYTDPKFGTEMIRDCSVSRGDIIVGADGAYHVVLKKDIGNGKWNIKSGTKILRWKKDVVDKIKEMGFSLNPGNWGKAGVTRESLMTDLGYVKNDLND